MTNQSNTLRVDIISDVVCPWCIIGYKQLQKAAEENGTELDIHWQPFELNPSMPAAGQNLREHISEKYGTSEAQSAATREHITKTGAELGIGFNFQPESRIMNTFNAHKLIHWAESQGRQNDMKMRLIEVYFVQGKDVSRINVLLDVVRDLGLDAEEAQRVIEDESVSDEVRNVQHFWLRSGVNGVPSMVFNKKHLVTGAQGEANYALILRQLSAAEAEPA